MTLLKLYSNAGYWSFDADECRAAGRGLATQYQSAQPFPHIAIDNFLPSELLQQIADHYPDRTGKVFFDRDQERFKYQFAFGEIEYGPTKNLLAELNSAAFAGFLEEMTGIKGLISDPYYVGGGLHLTRRGGHLGVHADFNIHNIMQVERRLNLLIYLNGDWQEEYGGALELWDKGMTQCERSILPVLGRAVVFTTDLNSFHGQPQPLTCPEDRDRRSIATYYYTSAGVAPDTVRRSTAFQVRPGGNDRIDWSVKVNHLVNDWVPPRLQAPIKRMLQR